MYATLARWCFRRPLVVIGGWIAALVLIGGLTASVGPAYDNSFTIPASESADGIELLEEHFEGFGSGFTGSIVFRAPDGIDQPDVATAMSGLFDEVGAFDEVVLRSPYDPANANLVAPVADDGSQIAYASLSLGAEVDQLEAGEIGRDIEELIGERGIDEIEGLQIEIGGAALAEFEPPESETLGLAFAVIVLIVAMGSVVAMGTTVGVALAGVGIGALVTGLISNLTTVPDFATTIGLMIGLGVGIDYALFIVTRYREATRQGQSPERAIMIALDTAGRSVIFAGMTVVVSLLGLLLIGLAFVAGMGIAAATTVTVVMAASITLLPAAVGLVKEQAETTKVKGIVASGLISVSLLGIGLGVPQLTLVAIPLAVVVLIVGALPLANNPLQRRLPPRREPELHETVWYRLSHTVQARPWFFAIGGTLILVVLALPVLSLNLGFSDEGNFSTETSTRRAYDLLAEGFGPGSNGQLLIVTELAEPGDIDELGRLSQVLNGTEGVAFASPPQPSANGAAALVVVQPTTAPQDQATEDLVLELRDEVIPATVSEVDPLVSGFVAANIDFTEYLGGRIVIFFGAVLGLSFLLLMVVFRSVLVPLKAVIMNMLSIGAAYGVAVAIFQWGWFGDLLGIEPAPIEPFLPMMMFAIVFGLSMDYEVFLLSRIKEEFERSGDPVASVASGLAATARVITTAAAIMVVVFGSFVFEDDRIIKLFGVGLASAVLLDATLVRILLVPSTMQLLGARNWWLPGWLDRILPNLDVEGHSSELAAEVDRGPDTDPGSGPGPDAGPRSDPDPALTR